MPRYKVLEVDTAAELEVKLNSQENSNYPASPCCPRAYFGLSVEVDCDPRADGLNVASRVSTTAHAQSRASQCLRHASGHTVYPQILPASLEQHS